MPKSRFLLGLLLWAKRNNFMRKMTWAVSGAAVVSGVATYVILTSKPPFGPDAGTITGLLIVNLVILLLLGLTVVRGLLSLWLARKNNPAGSKLHRKLVVLLSVLAVVPTIIVAVFSAVFFNLGVEAWFSERVNTAMQEARFVAEAYLREHQEVIRADIQTMATDINREAPELTSNPALFEKFIETHASLRSLAEAIVFDKQGQIYARSALTFSLEFEPIPTNILAQAERGDVAIYTSDSSERVRALIRLDQVPGAFLYVGRLIDQTVLSHMENTHQAVLAFEKLSGQRSDLQILFALVYLVVAFLLLLAAISVGLNIANKLVRPIGDLIDASGRVAAGDLQVQVDSSGTGEIGQLVRAFNRMTGQLESQRWDLISANQQIDERRRFTEIVLSGVSAGVIGLDADGTIQYPNRRASELLGIEIESHIGEPLSRVLPLFDNIIHSVNQNRREKIHEAHLQHEWKGVVKNLHVRAAADMKGDVMRGIVLTFDDVSQLMQAQRTAAWADVARRLAHEIRNPLTPIQLSAERLKRKYLKQISEDPDTFINCTDTIVRHVGDLGRMLDEFSSFARMPAPVMHDENPAMICRESILLQRHAHPEIEFTLQIADKIPRLLHCDSRLIRQGMTNLIKNSVEAIEALNQGAEKPVQGKIIIELSQDEEATRIIVTDNGKGFPKEGRERLVEPYVTTRSKGTGLGLAIVKKIMEDHKGDLILEDSPQAEGGAKVTLVFFAQQGVIMDNLSQPDAA